MKLSIITTVYQAEKDLPRLLDSMMAQKSPELEFFLIDNGCTDGSAAICEEYAKKDSRFKIHTLKENIGYIAARNLGLELVDADYVGFSDSDDFLEPGGYDKAIEEIKQSDCDLFIGGWNMINDTVKYYHPPFPEKLYTFNEIERYLLPQFFGKSKGNPKLEGFMWKQIFRLSLIKRYNVIFEEYLKPCEDLLFNAKCIKWCNKVCISYIVLYNYIVSSNSITGKISSDINFHRDYILIYNIYQALKPLASGNDYCMEALQYTTFINLNSVFFKYTRNLKGLKGFKRKYSNCIDLEFVRDVTNNLSMENFLQKLVVALYKKNKISIVAILAYLGNKLNFIKS